MTLHRSLVFWAGVIVMGSIVWAWRESTRTFATLVGGRAVIMSACSGLTIGSSSATGRGFRFKHGDLPPETMAEGVIIFHAPVFLRSTGQAETEDMERLMQGSRIERYFFVSTLLGKQGDWRLYIPYWLILTIVMITWSARLGWLWRRRSRSKVRLVKGGAS
jgi:hypothetical protein